MIRCISLSLSVICLFSCSSLENRARKQEQNKQFFEAERLYQKLYDKTPHKKTKRGYLAYKLALCNHELRNFHKAYRFYKHAERYNYQSPSLSYNIAYSLHSLGKYKEAQKYYEASLKSSSSILAKNGLSGLALSSKETHVLPTYKLEPISRRFRKYRLYDIHVHSESGSLYFSSSQLDKRSNKVNKHISGLPSLYVCNYSNQGELTEEPRIYDRLVLPHKLGVESFSITSDGCRAYYVLTNKSGSLLYTSEYNWGMGTWETPQVLKIFSDNGNVYDIKDPQISSSGRKLYFCIKDSLSKADIYEVDIDGEKLLKSPQRLAFNTMGDDLSPYPVGDSLLYFASDGYPSYGGLDLFQARRTSSGSWVISHFPQPINSSADDVSFVPMQHNKGIIVSNRDNSKGHNELYSYMKLEQKMLLNGVVLDRDGHPISGAQIRMVCRRGAPQEQYALSHSDGSFSFQLDTSNNYVLHVSKPGYLSQYADFNTEVFDNHETFLIDFKLYNKQKTEILRDVNYSFGCDHLSSKSKQALNELFEVLVANPEANIKISSHTDRIGNKDFNKILSLKRARRVWEYLIDLGISESRISIEGCGAQQPYIVKEKDVVQYPFLRIGDLLDEPFILGLSDSKQRAICDSLNRRTTFSYINTDTF